MSNLNYGGVNHTITTFKFKIVIRVEKAINNMDYLFLQKVK